MSSTVHESQNGTFSLEKGDQENGHRPRRLSLVSCAKFETLINRAALEHLENEKATNLDPTEEEVHLLSQFPKDDSNCRTLNSLIFSVKNLPTSLPFIIKCIENQNGHIEHLETRPSKRIKFSFDILITVALTKNELLNIIASLRQIGDVILRGIPPKNRQNHKAIWFPKHVSDLDKCTHVLTQLESYLDTGHPGFSDAVYRARRQEIAEIAFKYKYGQSIPTIDYTQEEIKTWRTVFKKLIDLHGKYTCSKYRNCFRMLQEEGYFTADSIPQMQDISMFLKRKTGFALRPASGLVTARDFLASLAFRVFQCTQYVRHSSKPDHTPEPDCIHEYLGHVPMFADPSFADFSQEIGLASLGASDEDIEKLATIYFYTVEFGLCNEDNSIKAYGAALLSSYGELQHALSEKPKLRRFEPEITAVTPYDDSTYQNLYFVADSFNEAKEKVRNFVNSHFHREYNIVYDPYTESVKEMDSLELIEHAVESMKLQISTLTTAISRLKGSKE
ncbi:tyrosine 3-monooxygenase-like [Argiope bruennichi]|uniref:tyrosine 3-monooxygenase-like n=1 Tax=Argiope bruennichi TaxID=94029 RepID=UPI0024950D45|nr:tyrosine 3-monooxygenase-like [Argiope bruennichi]